jgi:hypothetical protein
MMLSGIESELRGIIETLKSGPVEDARGPTVKLIGFVLRTSKTPCTGKRSTRVGPWKAPPVAVRREVCER